MGTCLGMVGVVLLTRASKVDQQVHPALPPLLLSSYRLDILLSTCPGVFTPSLSNRTYNIYAYLQPIHATAAA